ncbi:unnamed protein product [Rhizopus stolonifer]
METAIRKGTRLDYNPPKQKHLSALTGLTFDNPGNAVYIVDLLEKITRKLLDFLIIIHSLMINGDGDKTIAYIETKPSALDTTKLREKSSGVVHIQNIYLYTAYLQQKVVAYRQSNIDYVKDTMGKKEGRLRHTPVSKGLLKETVILQKLIGTLLKCNFLLDDVDNNISLYAYRLLVEDLLVLFQVLNEAIVNILEHYFAMSKPDARTSLEIYKRFAKQTEDTITYLERAKRLQRELNISIPNVNHAPLSLASALQEYLDEEKVQGNPVAVQPVPENNQQPKELIDFFASLENDNVNMFYNQIAPAPVMAPPVMQPPVIQPSAMAAITMPQPTGNNPFRQTMQPVSPTANNANPFRASTMPLINNGHVSMLSPNNLMTIHQPLSNNPFAMNSTIPVASPIQMNSNHNPFNNNQPASQNWGQSNTLF